jgi:nitrogen regulatory protein PII
VATAKPVKGRGPQRQNGIVLTPAKYSAVETQQVQETVAVPDLKVELRLVDHGVEPEGTKMRKGGRNTW